jgi:hypothetical protein
MALTFAQAADHLNDVIDHAEDVFASRFKIRAEILLDPEKPEDGKLVYHKRTNGYGFAVHFMGSEVPTPLLSCPIDVRIRATGRFPDLYNACMNADKEALQRIVDAASNGTAFIKGVR